MENEQIYHAIAYFIKETDNCQLVKILKLLYLFDLRHVKETGIPATNLKYEAWKWGPVAKTVREKIVRLNDEEFKQFFDSSSEIDQHGNEGYVVEPKFSFDEDLFSERQLEILKNLVKEFKDSSTA